MFRKLLQGCLASVFMLILVGCDNNPIKFKQSHITLEYGDKLGQAKDYVESDDKEVLQYIAYDYKDIPLQKGKDFHAIGEYNVTFTFEDSTRDLKVSVKDTKAPTFSKDFKKSIEIYEGQTYNFEDYKAEDLDEVKITANMSNANFTKAGKYIVPVTASDTSGNKTTQNVEVVVKSPVLKLDRTLKIMYEGESFILKADVKGKDSKAQFKSSDSSVASVTQDGKVVAKKNGTATITAEANGIKKTCKVTVKEEPKKPVSNSNTGSSSNSGTTKPKPTNPSQGGSSSSGSSSSGNSSSKPSTNEPYVASLNAAKRYNKIMVVSASNTSTSKGTFEYFTKSNEKWVKEFSAPAQLGSRGINKVKEGDKKTPTGLFTFTHVMGIASNPGTKMPYHKIDGNDYWCGGKNHYNQFVDEDKQSHNCNKTNDERLINYTTPYQYLAALNYNSSNTYGKGSAIFLHCNGNSGVTAGCIGISKSYMKRVLKEIDSSTCIIIDLKKNISKY